MTAHVIPHGPCILAAQPRNRARHIHEFCRVTYVDSFPFQMEIRIPIFVHADRHRQRYLPKGYNGCAARCSCTEELVAGRFKLCCESFLLILAGILMMGSDQTTAWDWPRRWIVPQRSRRFARVLKQRASDSWPCYHQRARILSVVTPAFSECY